MQLDKEQALKLLASIGALDRQRTLQGEEREQVLTMLRLIGPGEQSNNQQIWTESWTVGGVTYNHHVGEKFDILEEVMPYDFQSH